ncbi:MAG: cation-translocating P-type ATPase [Proteobacteria bacterium]|jgi:Ca2+-transporting ATPase|nr:cation-translocating P-type ATPase [Pseudomonadota bacterium]
MNAEAPSAPPLPPSLSERDAAARLARDGYNELPSARPPGFWAIAWDVVREPMLLLLVAAATVYLVLGDHGEAIALALSVLVMIGITLHQRRKTERALEALRGLASPRAQVLRDGAWRTVAGRDVVVDDLLRVKEGDRISADAHLETASDLMVDESLLTGESVPVAKRPGGPADLPTRPGGDDQPWVYSGTLVTRGQGLARVVATGRGTEMGRIGGHLAVIAEEPTALERETRRAVVVFAAIGGTLCALVVAWYGIVRDAWLQGLLAGITLAMANIPEEFPVVLTVFLALGAWRIAASGVLARRASAVEALGAAAVLGVDKTGTLTENRMAVARLVGTRALGAASRRDAGTEDELDGLVEILVLASERDAFDPMERALWADVAKRSPSLRLRLDEWMPVRTWPLSPAQLTVTRAWRRSTGPCRIAAKGAPEAIADLCGLTAGERAAMLHAVDAMARDGLRVLAAAGGEWPLGAGRPPPWPETQRGLALSFAGLVGFLDPVREGVPEAIAECRRAGIRTVMITGDHAATARAIARTIGLAGGASVATGADIDAMTPAALRACAATVDIYARVTPEHKLRLVQAFKANGQVVAMTGDGVNDAPALRAANIGVAMGQRGSDVAREAAALVLVSDDFASLVAAIALGRRIHDNLRKAIRYIISVHVPTVGMALVPLAAGWPLVFFPIHIVFLELVIDPACAIAFEAEPPAASVMRRPPRSLAERLFDMRTLAEAFGEGAIALAAVAALYAAALALGAGEETARAAGFASVVLVNLALIVGNRAGDDGPAGMLRANRVLWWIVCATLAGLAITLYVAPVSHVFRIAPLPAEGLAASALPAAVTLGAIALWRSLRGVAGARRAGVPP